jgi:predicted amidohydrolase
MITSYKRKNSNYTITSVRTRAFREARSMQNPSVVRICSAQISSIWEEPEKTLEKAGMLVRHAAASGAALICFPEQFATGWDPLPRKNIQDIHGSIVSSLQALAKESGISVLGSFRQAGDPLPKNTAVVIGRDGRILSTYAKIHLFSHGHEDEGNTPGTDLGLFSLGPLRCGVAICYDLRFAELFRLYARKGVQVVVVPSAWPRSRTRHWELFIQARALENQMYIVGVNTTGKTPVESYAGNSMTADPQGTVISRANEAEQLVFADLDPAAVVAARCQLPVERDRKDALYRFLGSKRQSG